MFEQKKEEKFDDFAELFNMFPNNTPNEWFHLLFIKNQEMKNYSQEAYLSKYDS